MSAGSANLPVPLVEIFASMNGKNEDRGCTDLPVQLVKIFTSRTGKNEGRLNQPIQHAVKGRETMARERNSLDRERNSLDREQVEVMEMKKNLQADQLDPRFSVKGVKDIAVERNSLSKENEEVVMMKTKNNLELRTRQETNPTKFDKIFNFWEDMGGKVGRTGMLLQPGESSGIGDRKRKREVE